MVPYSGSIPARAGKPSYQASRSLGRWVYPRTGGETSSLLGSGYSAYGLSPHGRGNHQLADGPIFLVGSIPARAGKPDCSLALIGHVRVYPRTGGETVFFSSARNRQSGLSPHGRGNRLAGPVGRPPRGSIPARAGKPVCWITRPCWRWVYPRTGGETVFGGSASGFAAGLSPHGRGNRPPHHPARSRAGSIPARAGKPTPMAITNTEKGVYPRTGGETCSALRLGHTTPGLSPHGRGNHGLGLFVVHCFGSIPARAGKPPAPRSQSSATWVYPRTGGETAFAEAADAPSLGLSPHGRGNLLILCRHGLTLGSIPARAGKPIFKTGPASIARVYPRTGGETGHFYFSSRSHAGLSPHGRGNPCDPSLAHRLLGSIPARAGKPQCRKRPRKPARVYPRTGGETVPSVFSACIV